jgi:hypothetical protein
MHTHNRHNTSTTRSRPRRRDHWRESDSTSNSARLHRCTAPSGAGAGALSSPASRLNAAADAAMLSPPPCKYSRIARCLQRRRKIQRMSHRVGVGVDGGMSDARGRGSAWGAVVTTNGGSVARCTAQTRRRGTGVMMTRRRSKKTTRRMQRRGGDRRSDAQLLGLAGRQRHRHDRPVPRRKQSHHRLCLDYCYGHTASKRD